MARIFVCILLMWIHGEIFAQKGRRVDSGRDSLSDTAIVKINRVDVYADGEKMKNSLHDHSDFKGVSILSGKKYTLISPGTLGANITENNGRQIFAKVPGITAMEMDGSGVQLNLASRGLNPHRSSEFNVNQNGINVNSDLFGYPEVHYNPPMEGIKQIEVIKGSAALQYGPQFGGMINYIVKGPEGFKTLGGESNFSLGSFGLMSQFTSLGGQKGKWKYFGFFNYRGSNGWRPNSRYDYFAAHGSLYYSINKRVSVGLEVSKMAYTIQLPGGLTELQYAADARQSLRQRNYYSPDILIPALVIKSEINDKTTFLMKSYVLSGERNSVAYIASPMFFDTLNVKLGTLNPRQVDRDFYRTFTTDLRWVHRYDLLGREQVITAGYKFSRANTRRQQFGKGTVNSDFDITLTQPGFGVDLLFRTLNQGFFVENLFRITPKWSISPGIRFDFIGSKMTGDLLKYQLINQASSLSRYIFMKGLGTALKLHQNIEGYSNYSQAYHPVMHSDLMPSATLAEVDSHLKDSKGYNFDLGVRGRLGDGLRFDVSYFRLFYGNRLGSLMRLKPDGTQYLFRTNIGDALNTGLEAFAEVDLKHLLWAKKKFEATVFCAYALNHARYVNGSLWTGANNAEITGHWVEDVPFDILRWGSTVQKNRYSISFIYSQTGEMFSDANNTKYNASGITGLIPKFHVIDCNGSYTFAKRYQFKLGVNNVENKRYFNRRVNNYLGPGILSAPGRSVMVSLGVKF